MGLLRRIPLWLSFVLVAVAGVGLVVLALLSFQGYKRSADTTLEASAIVVTESSVYNSLLEAESSQRGYLLTGDESFVTSYSTARDKVNAGMDALSGRLTSDDDRRAFEKIQPNVAAKLAEMDQTLQLARSGDRDGAMRVVESGTGTQLTNSIIEDMKTIAVHQAGRHSEARATAKTRSRESLIVVSALGLFVAGALLWMFRSLRRRGVEEGLRRLNQEKDQFLGMVSHELRTPITVVLGNASLLRRKSDELNDEQRAAALADIESEGQRMQGVVANMLRLSRPQQQEEPELEPVLLSRLIQQSIRRHQARFPSPPVQFRESAPSSVVLGNEDYLGQVVENLLSNAAKYGSPSEPIEVEVRAAGDVVQVAVMDRGPGIVKARQSQIFEPFVRLAGEGHANEGLGLGLPICRLLMKAQHGDVSVSDRPGGGSVFTLAVPLAPDPEGLGAMEVADATAV